MLLALWQTEQSDRSSARLLLRLMVILHTASGINAIYKYVWCREDSAGKTENLKVLLISSVYVPPAQLRGSKWHPGPSGKVGWRFTLKMLEINFGLLVEKKQIVLFCTIKQRSWKPERRKQARSNLVNSESFEGGVCVCVGGAGLHHCWYLTVCRRPDGVKTND